MTTTKPVALVTGASSGIGEAATRALASAGYEVIGTSRDASRVAAWEGVTLLDLDVSSDDSVTAAVEQVIARFGRIDLLVNNAGMGAGGAAEESSIAQDQRLFDINVFGVMRMTKAVLLHMRAQRGGRIINISSIVGLIPAPYLAAYAATKHAIEGYSESLDHEVRMASPEQAIRSHRAGNRRFAGRQSRRISRVRTRDYALHRHTLPCRDARPTKSSNLDPPSVRLLGLGMI